MAAAVQQRQDNEIDRFISDQRQKLQQERHTVNKKGRNVGKQGQAGVPRGRLTWDQTGHSTQLPAQQGNKGKKHTVNFGEWEKGFQDDKRNEYNKYLRTKENQGRVLKKEPTPPFEGMKFGGYEEYKREQEPERRRQYKQDLEKQKREQAYIKMKRDYPNKQPVTNVSPRQGETTDRSQHRSLIENRQQKQYSKMLAQQPTVRDVRLQDTQPRRRSPSPEFSDPGMQLQADRIRARIRDLPTRPEEVEELQRKQQQQDTLQRQLEEISPRVSYEERRPPLDLSPRLDDYGPGPSDRYPPLQEDYRQPTQGQGSRSQPLPDNRQKRRGEPQLFDEGVRRHKELQRHLEEEERKRRQAEHDEDENLRKQLATVKRRQELEEKRKIKQKLENDTRMQLEEERRKDAQQRLQEQTYRVQMQRQAADKRQRAEEEKRQHQVKHQEGVRRQIADKNRQEVEEKKKLRQEQLKDEGMLNQLDKGRKRVAAERRRKEELEEEQNRQFEETRRLLEEGRPSTVHVRFEDDEEQAAPRRQRPYSEHTPGYEGQRRQAQSRRVKPDPYPRDPTRPELLASLPQGQYEMERERIDYDRQRQNEEMLSKNKVVERMRFVNQKTNTGRRLKREKDEGRPVTPGGLLNKMGRDQQERTNKLNNERKKEYNQLLTQVPPRTQARFEDSQQENFNGGPLADDAEQMRKRTERNDEYNEFLRNKEDKQRAKSADRRPPLPRERPRSRHGRNSPVQEEVPRLDLGGGAQPPTPRRKQKQPETFQASLPGLQTNSAQRRRKEEERNREYNEMLKKQKGRGRGRGSPRDAPPETRRGWQTPTYDEILEKKRREERQYRRQEDPYGDNRGMRPYASEGAINRVGVDDVKMRDLDREYEQRRVRFQNERSKERGILDDDNWLRTDAAKEQEYSKLNTEEPPNMRRKDMSRPPGDFFATLPLGQPSRDSATRRKKQKYRDELQLQMRDTKAAKFREKNEELMVAASGYLDPEKTPVRVRNLGQPEISPRRRVRSPEVTAYHAKIVQRQQAPQGNGYDPSGDFGLGGGVAFGADASAPKGRRRDRGGYEPSLLEGGGFDTNLLEPRRPTGLALPPGLQYQPTFGDLDPDTGVPSTYITGQDSLGGLNAHSSIDDAYRFYGMRNPLDPEPSAGGNAVPPLNLGGDNQAQRGRSPRVTFDDSHRGILKDSARRPSRHRSPGRTTPYQFDADQEDRSTINMNKREYANELARQMELDKMKRERARQENLMYEKKIEEDMLNYNPFGRSGGGAPNLDAKGQPIADLRQMKKRVDDPSYTPPPRESPRFRAPVSPKDDLIPPPPSQINAEGESTYALGGHGIFGNPRTEEEKSKADKYKDDLRLQILEKKRHDQLKKEQEKIEEEKENRRLEEQRQRIQRDFDEEQRKKREKEEENRRKQEELIRKNEEKRREAERAKREKAEIRQRDRERELDDQNRYESQHRSSSPPVPTLRSKIATTDGEPKGEDGENSRTDSPPVPAARTQQEPRPQPKARPPPEPVQRANSSEVLRELANMRQQLESERKRVEGALNKQKNEPEVFDPRLVQRPPPKEVDVFERATHGNASVPQRVPDNANPKNIQEFQDLKYKAPDGVKPPAPAAPTSEASTGDTESRRAFRSMFPEQPYTNTTLESQQDAMLRQQNEQIRTLKDRSYVPPNDLGMSARQGTGTPRSLLQANTAFIDVENVNHFPEDFDDMPKRNDSARMRRRERATPLHDLAGPSNVMGSVSSLDVDRLQRKNDARIRRLQQMNADEVSMADPDEILENFMAKQRYNRPPSGQTLQDDTWLQPGNKQL